MLPSPDSSSKNFTIKLDVLLQQRVALAMKARGTNLFTEFARGGLICECRKVEQELKRESPDEFRKLYEKTPWS